MIDPHVVEARVSPEGRLRVLSKSEIASHVKDFFTSEDPNAAGNWLFGSGF